MELNMFSWNTRLYEYGTKNIDTGKIEKPFDKAPVEEVLKRVDNYMESNTNPIVVLQEIPFKRKNESNLWEYNVHYLELRNHFKDKGYDLIYLDNKNEWHIKMTMVLSKDGLLIEHPSVEKNNIFVPVMMEKNNISILAVHAHNAFELNEWIKKSLLYRPNIIIGDFNAGNYIKAEHDNEIALNRTNYQMLSTGYIDVCQGKYTTNYSEPTQIDHILIENSFMFNKRFAIMSSYVDDTISVSDHYPISCKLEIE